MGGATDIEITPDISHQTHSHDCSVEISDLEDVEVMLGLNVGLHRDVLPGDGHHAGHVLMGG